MLPSYFDYSFVHLRQKERLRPELSPKIFVNFRPQPKPYQIYIFYHIEKRSKEI